MTQPSPALTGTPTTAPIRGAIRTSVSTSTENLVAGQEFSVFVTIQNPFEVPLSIHRVSTHLPTEFADVDQLERARRAALVEQYLAQIEEAGREVGLPGGRLLLPRRSRLSDWFRRLSGLSVKIPGLGVAIHAEGAGTAVARDLSSRAESISIGVSLPFIGSITRTITRDVNTETDPERASDEWRQRLVEERDRYYQALLEIRRDPSPPTDLQSGNSTTRVFTLRSRKGVWFRPASYRLQIEVEYEIGGTRNVDTIEHVLNVKASLGSMLFGSVLGGLTGWIARHGATSSPTLSDLLSAAIAVITSAMTVVLFARKKDVQPVIAVEDFWGGVAIGFLVAYAGQDILAGLTRQAAP